MNSKSISPLKKGSTKFEVDPDFKLTARRRNNMHSIISNYNLMRKMKLKKHMSKYQAKESGNQTVATLLLDLRHKSDGLRLEATNCLGELESMFESISQLTAKIGSNKF